MPLLTAYVAYLFILNHISFFYYPLVLCLACIALSLRSFHIYKVILCEFSFRGPRVCHMPFGYIRVST